MHANLYGWSVAFLLLESLCLSAHGSFLYDSTPPTYSMYDPIPFKVNKLASSKSAIPYSYYSLPFCTRTDTNPVKEDFVSILRGDHLEDPVYEINALEPIECRVINFLPSVNNSRECTEYGAAQLAQFAEKVKLGYTVQWTLDTLPAAVPKFQMEGDHLTQTFQKQYTVGFPLGSEDGGLWLNNHVDINIVYQNSTEPSGGIMIVGFEIAPRSQMYNPETWTDIEVMNACPHSSLIPYERLPLELATSIGNKEEGRNQEVIKRVFWTYSVHWEESVGDAYTAAARWDPYMRDTGKSIHMVSLMNAGIIVLFLIVLVIGMVKRVFSSDPLHYDEDETRWRTMGMEALRAPSHPMALSVLIGVGIQTVGIIFLMLMFGILGLLSPAAQGTFTMPMVVSFMFMGVFAGFCSIYFYNVFRGSKSIKTILLTATVAPTAFFAVFLINTIALHQTKSSAAMPYTMFAKSVLAWFGVSVPLVVIGSIVGCFRIFSDSRVHTCPTVRTVERKAWYQRPLFSIVFAGVLPFGVVVIEYFFILYSIWGPPIYSSYFYLFVSVITLFVTSATTNLVACFYQLNAGIDPDWWWRPYLHGCASAIYMLVYATIIFFTNFKLTQTTSILLYFSFTILSILLFFLFTSTVGFVACYIFVQTIYKHTETTTLHSRIT